MDKINEYKLNNNMNKNINQGNNNESNEKIDKKIEPRNTSDKDQKKLTLKSNNRTFSKLKGNLSIILINFSF